MKALKMLYIDKKWIEEQCDISKMPIEKVQTIIKDLVEIKEAIAELEALQHRSCEWEQCDTVFDTSWEGTCGAKWTIEHGTPKQNHMNFCPQCGGKLIQIEPKEQ